MVPYRCNPETVARRLRVVSTVGAACVLTLWGGCAPTAATQPEPHTPKANYREVQVDRVVVTSEEALTSYQLFERGRSALERGAAADARRDLDLVVEQDPNGPWAEEALYLAAKAHEADGDLAGAAERFARVAERFRAGSLARDAHLRAVRLWVFLERWAAAESSARAFEEHYAERAPREEIVVTSAAALGVLHRDGTTEGGRAQAQGLVAKARAVIERYRLDGAGVIPRDLAQVYFANGELLRLRGEGLTFDPVPPDFADHFERRAQLLLDAQSAYSDVMRAHDAHWTAMAGYRVGELYQRLHDDVMSAPRPAALDTERRRLVFEAALRLRYSVLLKKGLTLMEHTLAMAERTGEESEWVSRARRARDELLAAHAREQAAVEACPYTREDMERVLAELARRSRSR